MSDVTDFDDLTHRVESATATFQRGLYHLFVLRNRAGIDAYDRLIRIYQCLFEMCRTLCLLDNAFELNALFKGKKLRRRLRRLCCDPDRPTRKELDPACALEHGTFEKRDDGGRAWTAFTSGHPLHSVAQDTLALYDRVVEARHNLLYRPFRVDGGEWQDCTLIDLIATVPSLDQVEWVYSEFVDRLWHWRAVEQGSRIAEYFIQDLFTEYEDKRDDRPRESLLLTYARMLNPTDEQFLTELRAYRNELLRLGSDPRFQEFSFAPEWRVGDV